MSDKFSLVIGNILRLLITTFTAYEKYSLLHIDNLTQPIHMILSQYQKNVSGSFLEFLKSILNLEHFVKNDDPHSRYISENTDSKKRC